MVIKQVTLIGYSSDEIINKWYQIITKAQYLLQKVYQWKWKNGFYNLVSYLLSIWKLYIWKWQYQTWIIALMENIVSLNPLLLLFSINTNKLIMRNYIWKYTHSDINKKIPFNGKFNVMKHDKLIGYSSDEIINTRYQWITRIQDILHKV